MSVVLNGQPVAPPTVTASRFESSARAGYLIGIGAAQVFLDDEAADKLGRYLLFDKEPAQTPLPFDTENEDV